MTTIEVGEEVQCAQCKRIVIATRRLVLREADFVWCALCMDRVWRKGRQ